MQMEFSDEYMNLFGFVPELTQTRHRFTNEVFPEILAMQEEFRKQCMHSDVLEEKTAQMILFAVLASHMKSGAKVHIISSRKLGASWKELHAVANLVFLFNGLSNFNFALQLLSQVKDEEEASSNSREGGR